METKEGVINFALGNEERFLEEAYLTPVLNGPHESGHRERHGRQKEFLMQRTQEAFH